MLEVKQLCAGYGKAEILHEVSLEVPDGKLVVLIGPNGHGKTTLLRALSGLLPAKSGDVVYNGESMTNLAAAAVVQRGLVHIPQGDLLFVDMSVEQNLLMGSYSKNAWKARHERLERVYTLFPVLKERRSQQSRTLSGGERRMLSLGRGLMSSAQFLMIDEPALGLAPVLVQELYASLATIVQSEATVLLVEETLANAQNIADWVYLMEKGRIAGEGTPSEMVESDAMKATYLGTQGVT